MIHSMMALTSRPNTLNPNNAHDNSSSPPLPQQPSQSEQAKETHPRRYPPPPDSLVPPSAATSPTRLRNCTKITSKILLFLLLLFPAFNIYIGHQIIASDSSPPPPWHTEKDASSHGKIDYSWRRPSNDSVSASAARTRTHRTYPLPKAIPGTSLAKLRFPPRVMIPSDISNEALSKKLKANFPGWDVVASDPSSCRQNARAIMREWNVDSSRETMVRYISLVEDVVGRDLCILVQLYVYGGIFYSGGDDYELSGKGLLRKVTGDTEVLSMVFRNDRGGMEQVLLGAPAGHPVIRRAIEIITDILISLGKGNAAASTIMAIEELYNEPAPLNATRLASKGVYFLSISPPEDITAENSNGPKSVHENPIPNAIVAKAKPKPSGADPEQPEADFEPDIDEETLTPNVTMIRTMLVNGRDDDGNEFPPPMTDLCHAHPVEGSEHDYVKALKEAMIHTTGSLNSTMVNIAPWNHYGKDKHFAEKTDSLIEVPAPRLLCLVYTVRESHNDKIDAIRHTWAGGCDGFLVFSTTTDLTIPAIAIRHKGPEVYENMWQKVRSIWKYVGEHHLMEEYEWFHLGGDDMFIIPNNLKTYLASLAYTHGSPRTTPYFVGRKFKDLSHNHFNTGGPGYTLSQATLRKFLYNIEANQCSPNLKTPKEDVTISQCLTSLGVHLTDTRDAKGRERYHHFDPGWMMDYTPRKRDVGSPIPQESDWYELYNREWGMLFGADCCAPDSVSFHYVSAGAIRHMHALLHQCHRNDTFSRSTVEAHSQTETYCRWEPVPQPNTTALFRGDASRYRTKCNTIDDDGESRSASIYTKRLEVVISYCRPDTGFDWIYYDILLQTPKGWNVVLTFQSRCSGEKSIPDFREYANIDKVNVINIGNSGGQEYSYAKFINDFMKNPSPAVILFAKERNPIDFDRNNLGGYRNTSEMIDIASNYEFGCGIKPGPKHSWYHDKQTLHDVFLKEWKQPAKAAKSIFNTEKYENLQDFHHRALNYSFPPPKYTPVCYGGSFAIHSQKIIDFFQSDGFRGKGVMERLEHTLSRSGQPIIEELFVERSWAGFFSEPLSAAHESALGSDIKEIVPSSKPTAGQIKILL